MKLWAMPCRDTQDGWVMVESSDKMWSRWQRISLQSRRQRFSLWLGKIPWRRTWQPIPAFLPGEFHARHLVGYSPWGSKSWAWLSEWHFHFHRKYVKDFKWGRDMTRSRFWTDYSDHCMETRLVRLKNGWREKRWASVNNIHELLNRALYSSTNTYHAFTVWEAQWGIKRETNHSFWSLRNLFKMSLFFFIWFAC